MLIKLQSAKRFKDFAIQHALSFEAAVEVAFEILYQRLAPENTEVDLARDRSYREQLKARAEARFNFFDHSIDLDKHTRRKIISVLSISENSSAEDTVQVTANLHYSGAEQQSWDQRLQERCSYFFQQLITYPDSPTSTLPLVLPDEIALIESWNRTQRDYPHEAMVHELFAEQVVSNPNAIAVIDSMERWTYQQLNNCADEWSQQLHAAGIVPGALVCLLFDRSVQMIAAMLGAMKAGAAYVPLDPSYPTDRIQLMLNDSGASLMLTDQSLSKTNELNTNVTILAVGAPGTTTSAGIAANRSRSTDVAYVMYTSGSTGVPKGVAVTHRGIVRLVRNTNYIELGSDDVLAQVSKFSFDAMTFEVWGALLNGGTLVILPDEIVLCPDKLAEQLRLLGVTAMFLTASLFSLVSKMRSEAFGCLRTLIVGGDVVSPEAVRVVLKTAAPQRLVNGYGPTECTTFSLWHLIDSVPDSVHSIPIGKPIANSTAYILDSSRQLVPPGVMGEIYLGGDGLAVGYHQRPEMTLEKFLHDTEHPISGERLYSTGDKGCYLPEGSIEFHGRTDHQVKLRGHRIELGEIEAVLRQHGAVSEAVAVVRQLDSGEKCLAAYVTSHRSRVPATAELKEFLSSRLPHFMVPAVVVVLDEFPLTPVGKIDRSALPSIEPCRLKSDHVFASEIEEKIASTWRDVLQRQSISPDENFFDAGGTSLLLAAVQSQLSVKLKNVPSIGMLLQFPTVRSLAKKLTGESDRNETLSHVQHRAQRRGKALRSSRMATKQELASHLITRGQI